MTEQAPLPSASVQHRVLGDLNLVHGLLGLARRRVADAHAAAILESSRARVRAIALVYTHGWEAPDERAIDPGPVLRAIVEELRCASDVVDLAVSIDVDDVVLDRDRLLPVVLVVRELVDNAFGHAFRDRVPGRITISLRRSADDGVVLVVEDDGVGLPHDVEERRARALGLSLVSMLAEQTGARVTSPSAGTGGARWVISFPRIGR